MGGMKRFKFPQRLKFLFLLTMCMLSGFCKEPRNTSTRGKAGRGSSMIQDRCHYYLNSVCGRLTGLS